jgi:superfamily I DNA/RNA helicase
MTYVLPDDWKSSPQIRLEGTALEIVRSDSSISVLAGPGAGKTELLAQRAAYLLSTGLCPPPRRILAISFKVDAARNLQERVSDRTDAAHANRFESLTLDAFSKRIVDQFLEALPGQMRPSPDYRIIFTNRDVWEDFGNKYSTDYPDIRAKSNKQLERITLSSVPNFSLDDATTLEQQIQYLWWRDQIKATPSCLTFDMIRLLAMQILQDHETILAALRRTYSHVFLDEFQDVTQSQYDLVKKAFLGSNAVITAVGDSNQAIMRWAGAKADIFDQFETDFHAADNRLLFNFRSNSRVVQLINDLTETFDGAFIPTECARQDEPVPENAVEGWVFETRQAESDYLAKYIAKELEDDPDLKPSDFVILARLRINDVEDRMKPDFQNQGLKLRNEARQVAGIAIQDLVKEKAYIFLISALKLAVDVRVGQPFQECRNTIADVRGADLNSDQGHSKALFGVRDLTSQLKDLVAGRDPAEIEGQEISDLVLSIVSKGELQRTYREYVGGERLDTVINGFAAFFDECREGATTWSECISDIEGDNSVRLMTIHKSKGLEYHTVIFVEFNDDSFWGNDDDVNVFFVALSRARERVHFSFTRDSKGSSNIKGFVETLQAASVSFSNKP